MKHPTRSVTMVLVVALLSCASLAAAGAEQEAKEDAPSSRLWDRILALYEAAKETGEQVPKDIYEWAQQDFGKIGDWEYRVLDLETGDATAIETKLNELGAARWECMWIQPIAAGTRFILKRPARSYLRSIPLTDILKFFPGKDSGSLGD